MKFDIKHYAEDFYVMNCKTKEEAEVFLGYLKQLGKHWRDGSSYNNLHYSEYLEETCYAFNKGQYGSVAWYKSHGYTILTFEDFEWEGLDLPSPTTADLKRFNNFFSQFVIT